MLLETIRRHPERRKRASAVFSLRAGVRDLVFAEILEEFKILNGIGPSCKQ